MLELLNIGKLKKMVLLLLISLPIVYSFNLQAQNKIIASVNHQDIDGRELQREIWRHRSQIIHDFTITYELKNLTNFWDNTYEGKQPKEELQKKSLLVLVKIKIQEQWLKAENLWPYKNYDELLKDMNEVNSKRAQLVKEGKVIYGTTSFTEQTFFDYKFSNAVITLKKQYKNTKILVNDSLLTHHFEELRKTTYANTKKSFHDLKTPLSNSYLEKEYEKLLLTEINKTKLHLNKTEWNNLNL
jgi:hypothetical protein